MESNIGISEENKKAVADILGKLLADEYILYTKTRNAHWNVEGPDFHTMHIFFEQHYKELDELLDTVAERIRKIGQYAPATLKNFLKLTHLIEQTERTNDSRGYITELSEDHESIIKFIRENIDPVDEKYEDAGTSDYLTGLMEKHEEMVWMLRAHLK